MGWSTEVHDSRLTTAILQAKREARLRRAHKLPEPQGNSGPWPLAAVAGIVLSAVALQRDGRWQHAKSKLSQFCRQLQQRPQQGGSSNSRPHSSQSSPRDKTATASSSGRVAPPAAQSQETGSSQSQRKPKAKKKKGRRR
ncbi:hypothetical protein WJX82_002788 [Trebouxia sp. C0006]